MKARNFLYLSKRYSLLLSRSCSLSFYYIKFALYIFPLVKLTEQFDDMKLSFYSDWVCFLWFQYPVCGSGRELQWPVEKWLHCVKSKASSTCSTEEELVLNIYLKQTSNEVYSGSCGTCMEIVKPFSAYLKLLSPAQPRVIRVIPMVLKRSLFPILIHIDDLAVLIAIPD